MVELFEHLLSPYAREVKILLAGLRNGTIRFAGHA